MISGRSPTLTVFDEDFFQIFFSACVGQVPDEKSSRFRHVFLFLIVPQLTHKISLLFAFLRRHFVFKVVGSEHFDIAPPCEFTRIMYCTWTSVICSTCFLIGCAPKTKHTTQGFFPSCVLVKKSEKSLTHVVSVQAQGPLDLCFWAQVHIHVTLTEEIQPIKWHKSDIFRASTDSKQQKLLPVLRPSLFFANRMATGFKGIINSFTCC